jgi:hypothetical protein
MNFHFLPQQYYKFIAILCYSKSFQLSTSIFYYLKKPNLHIFRHVCAPSLRISSISQLVSYGWTSMHDKKLSDVCEMHVRYRFVRLASYMREKPCFPSCYFIHQRTLRRIGAYCYKLTSTLTVCMRF